MKQIILRLASGQLAYSRPCAEVRPGESEADYLTRVEARTVEQLNAIGYGPVEVVGYLDDEAIPTDPLSWKYRDAWVFTGSGIEVDVQKAKPIALEVLRKRRNAELESLDTDEMRFALDPSRLSSVRARKQVLRDAPTALAEAVTASKTLDELEKVALP